MLILLSMPFQLFAANPAGIDLEVPTSARIGDIIKVKVNTSGGSEGIWFYVTGLKQIRGYFDHCGWCSTPCLVDDVIQTCSNCCGPYCLSCTWSSGHEFSNTWFGGPTMEYEVTGCGTATITPTYYGGSHEGPFTLKKYEINVLDGIVADFEAEGIGCVDDETKFENKSCGGDTFLWNFGDGKTSSAKSPVHIYETAGTYTVTLTASGPYGSDTATKSITITSDCATIEGNCFIALRGTPLPGTEITATCATASKSTGAVCGATGHYKMIVAAKESYSLLAEKHGFATKYGPTVALDPDEVYTWNAAMKFDDPIKPDKIEESSLKGDQSGNTGDPFNPATGNYYFDQSLFKFPGVRGINAIFRAAYNSSAASENGPLGYGWVHSYHIYITEDGDDVTVSFGDGHKEFFQLITGTDNYEAANCYPSIDLSKISTGGWQANIGGGLYWEFDSEGKLQRIHDLNNNAIALQHSTQLDQITDTQGRIIQFFYEDGRLTRITSPLVEAGDTVSFAYDAGGNLTGITDPRGHSWAFTYDAQHRLLTETDRRGILVSTNIYDSEGRLEEQRDALDQTTLINYQDTHYARRVTVTAPSGYSYTRDYDHGYNIIGIVDTKGLSATFAPGSNGKPAGAVDKTGQSVSFESNALGLPTKITDRLGIWYQLNYNAMYQLTSVVDQFGRTTSAGYDAKGNLTTLQDRNFDYTRFWVDSKGLPYYISYPAYGGIWDLTYNTDGTLQSIKDRNGNTTSYQYDDAGRINQINYPTSLGATKRQYDAGGNILWQDSPQGHRTSFTHNENNQILTRTFEPTGATTTYTYDKNGRTETITDALGGTTTISYDTAGNILSVQDQDGVTTTITYDERNEINSLTSASGSKTTFGYDANGKRIWIRNALGNIWRWTYDTEGRRTSDRDPLGNTTRYEHSLDGRSVRITDPLSRHTDYRLDDGGRITAIRYPDISEVSYYRNTAGMLNRLQDEQGNNWRYAYDYVGRLVRVTDPVGKAETYEYDGLGRVVKLTRRNGEAIEYAYDLDGRLTSMTLPGDETATYTHQYDANTGTYTIAITNETGTVTEIYDKLNRLVSGTDVWDQTVTYAYTAAGRLKKITYESGKDIDYSYDGFGRLMQIKDWQGNSTTFSYDDLDRISTVILPNGTRTLYTYDAGSALIGISHRKSDNTDLVGMTYKRDVLGHIKDTAFTSSPASTGTDMTTGFTYDQANRLLTGLTGTETTTYQFNDNGNLTTRTAGTVTTQFTFNALNRLISISDGTHSTGYAYDGPGKRVSKDHDGVVTKYRLAGGKILACLDGDNHPTSYNIYANQLLYSMDPAGSKRIYHTDERGSVIAVTDDDGNLIQSCAYSPYGKTIGSSGTLDNAFGFVGGWGVLTDENGLQYMKARYYDPEIRRFLTEDPIGTAFSPNVYEYAGGNPINRIDPTGRFPVDAPHELMDNMGEPAETQPTSNLENTAWKGMTPQEMNKYIQNFEAEIAYMEDALARVHVDPGAIDTIPCALDPATMKGFGDLKKVEITVGEDNDFYDHTRSSPFGPNHTETVRLTPTEPTKGDSERHAHFRTTEPDWTNKNNRYIAEQCGAYSVSTLYMPDLKIKAYEDALSRKKTDLQAVKQEMMEYQKWRQYNQ